MPISDNALDALFGSKDAKAIRKLRPSFLSFPGIGFRVFRDKRGNIVRVEDATDTKPLTRKQLSNPQGIELHAIDFMNSDGAKPASR
jgi:hypothetical protein